MKIWVQTINSGVFLMKKKNLSEINEYAKQKYKNESNPTFLKIYDALLNKVLRRSDMKQLEKKYFVSIIMPTFNRKKIISKAIDSVLKQYFKNYELIIVDDGSTDGSEDFIQEKYAKHIKSNKIKYFKTTHHGVSQARNFGVENASGNIIAYLDSDNQWHSTYLSTLIYNLDSKEEYNCAYCDVTVTNHNTGNTYVLNQGFYRKKLLKTSFIDINAFIHEKSLYNQRGGFDGNLSRLVDWDLIIRYTENNTPMHIHKTLVDCFLSSELNNIALTEPLEENIAKIQQKYWKEIYCDEYHAIKDYFDEEFYLNNYQDVSKSGMDPMYHYLTVGHKENKNPNAEFVTSFYNYKYPKVARYNLNPLVHYAKWGKDEGREINYFKKRDTIINNNLIYLANYEFEIEPLVSIIILNKDGLAHLKKLFRDFSKKTNYSNYEIIVVDNASQDDSVKYLKSLNEMDIKIIENKENVSFSKGNNDAVKIAKGEYILLLNNDIEPTYGWLNELMGTIIYNENVGAVGAKLVFPFFDDLKQQEYSFTLQHTGDIIREKDNDLCLYVPQNQSRFSPDIYDNSISVNRKCISVTGAVMLTRKDIYLEVGGLDESYCYGYEDVDFNLKLHEKGYDVIFASAALLFHHESATPRKSQYLKNHSILCEKWGEYLFKKLLRDKIEKNYFFTDKTLRFLFAAPSDFIEKPKMRNQIHSLNSYLNRENYNTSLKTDLSDLDIDCDVDILISFTQDFDVKNAISRKNLIKILILNNENVIEDDIENWDIVLCDNESIPNNDKVIYQNMNELNENIIPLLYETFLDE